jgi:hypothetical protein
MRISRSTKVNKIYRFPHEVFVEIQKTNSFHDRVVCLQENATFAIKTILQCNFSPDIHLDLPEGRPPYNADESPPDLTPARIDKAIKVLGKLALAPGQSPASGLVKIRKESLFINLLESVCKADAEIILDMKDKTLEKRFPSVDLTLVNKAFPNLV